MSKSQVLLANASWMYGSQLATVVVQMAYAAVTSRMVGADGFAAYGVALAVGALTILLANGGLGQAVGRMALLEQDRTRSLSAYSAVLGLAGAVVLYWTASFWAHLWGSPNAENPLQLMSISVLVSPALGLATGLLRRQGKFRDLSIAIFVSNCLGMLVGVASVLLWHSATSLLVSNICAQILLLIFATSVNWRMLLGSFSLFSAVDDLKFSRKLTAVSLVGYFNGNIGKFGVSNFMPVGSLGFWNRADVVTTIPFMQIQNAIIQAVYPEFRHDLKSGARASVVWTDLLTLVSWMAIPAAAIAAVLVPPMATLLFGPGWGMASTLSGPLALVAGIQIVSTVLASAVEALGKFRWIWSTQLMLLSIYVGAAAGCYWSREWYPIIVGLFAAQISQHALHIVFCRRAGYLDAPLLLSRYARIAGVSGLLALVCWFGVTGLETPAQTWRIPATICLLATASVYAWKQRRKLEPFLIAQRYRKP